MMITTTVTTTLFPKGYILKYTKSLYTPYFANTALFREM